MLKVMQSIKKYFGTDGIRGLVGTPPISADWVLKLGWAAGRIIAKQASSKDRNTILIGKDTRISGYLFESALEAGFVSAGVDVLLAGPIPTPAIAYLTRNLKLSAGIVISASHNPFEYNGIKFFTEQGTKLSDEMELSIEAEIDTPLVTVDSRSLGKTKHLIDAARRYIEFCKSSFPSTLNLKNLKCVVDCANGATYQVARPIFEELGANVHAIHVTPDGYNINANCGSTAPTSLIEQVKKEKADLGVALDGDGDRVILVDNKGEIVDGDEILFIIAQWYAQNQRLTGGIVGTVMSNYGLEEAFQNLKIPFMRAAVGDHNVLEMLKKNNWNLGGEASGHIICLDTTTTGDGLTSALKILEIIQATGKTLYELKQGMTKYPQILINVPSTNSAKTLENTQLQAQVQKLIEKLDGKGRVLIRPSGTEPVIRVMVEGKEIKIVETIANELATLLKNSHH